MNMLFFFFSSRRRHTRYWRDWSSDVCSSDLAFMAGKFMDEMPGMSFGHAGTIVEGKEDTASEKIARLAEAGITVAEQIGRASCRERVEISVVAVSLKKKNNANKICQFSYT